MTDNNLSIPLVSKSPPAKPKLDAGRSQSISKLVFVSVVCLFFMVVEIIGGFLANSIAIMTDAAHMFSDLSGFAIAIASLYISSRPASSQLTYGYHRAEIIGAIMSVALIWGLTIWLFYEAVIRVQNPKEVDGVIMLITAGVGLIVNIVMGLMLHSSHSHGVGHSHGHEHSHGHKESHKDSPSKAKKEKTGHKLEEDVNIRAASLHVLGDLLQSVGVTIAAICIVINPDWSIADPICTFIFSVIVAATTLPIMKECIKVLMEGTPVNVDLDSLVNDILEIDEVYDIHDLHVWSLSIGKPSLSCHLGSDNPAVALAKATAICQDKYNISHTTIQIENQEAKETFTCSNNLH